MNLDETHLFMRKAVSLARQLEGDWTVRMKMALNTVIVNHYFNKPLTLETVDALLRKGYLIEGFVNITVLAEKTLLL